MALDYAQIKQGVAEAKAEALAPKKKAPAKKKAAPKKKAAAKKPAAKKG